MPFDKISDSINLEVSTDKSLFQENDATARQIRDIIRYLQFRGAKINPSSRLHQYARLFEGPDDLTGVSFDLALLESLQFLAIARALSTLPDATPWIASVGAASSGHIDCRADRSRARSLQFELFTMACLTVAGFKVEPMEPDLCAIISGEHIAFAAKRLRSTGKLVRNLRDAANQITKSGLRGFIVLDVSFVNIIEKPVYVRTIEQQQAIGAVLLDGFAHKWERELLSAAALSSVLGVLLHASVIGRAVEPMCRFASRRWLLCSDRSTLPAMALIAAIQTLGRTPLPPVDLTPA